MALFLLLLLCWVKIVEADLFIQNGTDALPGKYPFFVGLHVRGYGLICGGTLIHPNVVLTVSIFCLLVCVQYILLR